MAARETVYERARAREARDKEKWRKSRAHLAAVQSRERASERRDDARGDHVIAAALRAGLKAGAPWAHLVGVYALESEGAVRADSPNVSLLQRWFARLGIEPECPAASREALTRQVEARAQALRQRAAVAAAKREARARDKSAAARSEGGAAAPVEAVRSSGPGCA